MRILNRLLGAVSTRALVDAGLRFDFFLFVVAEFRSKTTSQLFWLLRSVSFFLNI